jgi:uncharacterized protein
VPVEEVPTSPRSFAFRATILVVSFAVVAFGIAFMVSAHLGVAPADILSTGGAERLDIGVGTMGWISGGFFTMLAWFLKRPPQWGTIIGAVTVGFFVNIALDLVPEPDPLITRVPMLLFGLVLIYTAVSFGVATALGTGPMELVMLGLSDRGMSVQVARWGLEAVVFVLGVALGGELGVGTVMFVLLTGPVLARSLPPCVRFMRTSVLTVPTGIDA